MKTLFNFKLIAILLSFGFFATSCTTDDDNDNNNPKPSGNTEYNGEKFTIKNGYYALGNGIKLFGNAPTHHLDFLFLTDGTPKFSNDGEITEMQDGKIALLGALLSPDGASFKPGTFEYTNMAADINLTPAQVEAKYKNKAFFYESIVRMDTDGDKNWEEEADVKITGGTIKVTGALPVITTEYNLTLENGKTLKGSFGGTFQKLNMDVNDGE
ncbi:hypothetical protein AHMF7605_01985 [Adhaeribacter arboris]|uniref:Lipid/polyisoprenoid-binding YceI-like domain-containing protein n=1 Tax=Adhaeribacter arboris TaxID=2072846 RepID=A0A2T2YA47_9BACT|nr:hypothetical protein [Adhaeribacter arboris]PSR52379.1 hypothetical protein AHMF7605_01985 [Adhaeribacter arboris]